MKLRLLLAIFLLGAIVPRIALAQDPTPPTSSAANSAPAPSIESELRALVAQIQTKLKAGQATPAALTSELAAFDALLAKHRDQKADEVAQILLMKATLYLQVFDDAETGKQLLQQLKTDFPDTKPAAVVDRVLAQLDATARSKAAQAALVGQPAPELHFNWATRNDLKNLAALKGKVVVLDFWATWCGPCIASFPQMRELTAHYKGAPVEIVGVTSLQGRVHGLEAQPIDTRNDPSREHALMSDFIKAKDVTWTVAFSEEEVFNPDYGVTGIPHMAIIAPDGTVRHTGLHPAMPSEEKYRLIDAILEEFKLPTNPAPAKS
jgi:thiol-disulfide isomerase/thioredoxin